MSRRFESIKESSSSSRQAMDDDIVYVAVGTEVEESKPTLSWALQNFGGRVCILHVHRLSKTITSTSRLAELEHRIIQEHERQKMHKILDDYLRICYKAEVPAEKLCIETADDVEKGIVDLIYRHNIKKLVMGAAANKHYSEHMTGLKSVKALYVTLLVPRACQVWFICNGHLIHFLDGDDVDEKVRSPLLQASSIFETGQSNPETILSPRSSHNVNEEVTSPWSQASSISETGHSNPERRCSSVSASDLFQFERTQESEHELELCVRPQSQEDTSGILDGSSIDQLYSQLEQALVEAGKLKHDAFQESVRRIKAEKAVIEAARKARVLESSYTEELRRCKEIQEALAKEKEDLEKMKHQYDEESLIALDQKLLLESQVASSDHMMKELDEEIVSARELLQFLKKERDELQTERDSALKVTEELLKTQTEEASSSHMNQFFSKYSYLEIEEATCYFESSLKIGEGGYGSIYKGLLRHTPVAIKVLNQSSTQVPLEFQQEVDILSKLRHPNLVTLIGVCPEIYALVYEYLPNGSLEDRLICKDNTPPLSWQTRIRIATQLCSVLIFLHSDNPHRIVHGDLEPRNILLDENFVCKLSDFGICRALSLRENSSNMTLGHRIDSEDTFLYLDPQFLETGQLSPKSDIYSFGIILLQLLTGRSSPLDIAKDVQDAINEGNLTALLDPLAGDWPFVQAEQLAHLASRCCKMDQSDRPDLVLEVWSILEPMRASCRASSTFHLGPEEHHQPPSYFICPILQEVMQDPCVAADGFTYEAEAITGWLESHDTSPMTNLTLDHRNLVPNHTLRSAIQEWQQQH